MQIGQCIKEYRKKAGLTQEQTADYLGVSTPAVNKWERGNSFPDISLLPALARLLKIDLNTLFSFNEELTDHEIKIFMADLSDTALSGDLETAFQMAEEMLHKYPYSDILLFQAANILDSSLVLSKGRYTAEIIPDHKEKYKQQILAWYEQAAQSQDEAVKTSAISKLAGKYIENLEYERANKLVEQLPDINIDKISFQADIFMHQGRADEAAALLEGKLLQDLEKIQRNLYKLIDIEVKTKNQEKAEQIANITKEMVSLFGLWHYGTIIPHLLLALYQKDTDNSIQQLRTMLKEVQTAWDMKLSPLFYRIAQESLTDVGKDCFAPAFASELKNSCEYDFLRANPDFETILADFQKIKM